MFPPTKIRNLEYRLLFMLQIVFFCWIISFIRLLKIFKSLYFINFSGMLKKLKLLQFRKDISIQVTCCLSSFRRPHIRHLTKEILNINRIMK